MIDKAALLALLPPFERGSPLLDALIEAIGREVALVDADIAQLYDDMFIETAADWAVPYIGALVGYRPLSGPDPAIASPRAEVADWIALGRTKGTVQAIERLARDITGWQARVVEAARALARVQHLNLQTPDAPGTADLRKLAPRMEAPDFLDGPRSVDVRQPGHGRWNLPNLLVDLFETTAVLVREAVPATGPAAGQFLFDPLGRDLPLHAPAQALAASERVKGPEEVAAILTMRRLDALLDAAESPPFAIRVNGTRLKPAEMMACDLSAWRTTLPGSGMRAGIDPALGRFLLVDAPAGASVSADYWHGAAVMVDGAPAVLGAGAWPREDPAGEDQASIPATPIQLTVGSLRDIRLTAHAATPGPLALDLGANATLTLRAATGIRATLAGPLAITLAKGAELTIVGLLAGDTVTIEGEGSVTFAECTLLDSVTWTAGSGGRLTIERCATASLALGPLVDLTVRDSVVEGDIGTGAGGAGIVDFERVTVMGTVAARMCGCISDSIVTGPVTLRRTQAGCVRYSYVAPGSVAPGGFRRQPDTAIAEAVAVARTANPAISQAALDAIEAAASLAAAPSFRAASGPGDPDYAQLDARAGLAVRRGGESSGEMGAWARLGSGFRRANLRERLEDFVPVALAAAIFQGGTIR